MLRDPVSGRVAVGRKPCPDPALAHARTGRAADRRSVGRRGGVRWSGTACVRRRAGVGVAVRLPDQSAWRMVAANAIATAWCLPSRRPGALAPARLAREPNNRRARQPPSTRFQQHPRASPAPIHLHLPVPRVGQARRDGSERAHLRSAFGLLPECSAERVGRQCVEPRRRSVACIDQPRVARVPPPETLRRPRLKGAGFWRRTRPGCAGRQCRCTAPSWPSVEHCSGRPGADGRARGGASFIAGCRHAPGPGATP